MGCSEKGCVTDFFEVRGSHELKSHLGLVPEREDNNRSFKTVTPFTFNPRRTLACRQDTVLVDGLRFAWHAHTAWIAHLVNAEKLVRFSLFFNLRVRLAYAVGWYSWRGHRLFDSLRSFFLAESFR